MKRCPQCNLQYTDAWISFCSNDGAVLVEEPQRSDLNRPRVNTPQSERPTEWLPRQPPANQGWVAPDERQPMTPFWQPPPPPARIKSPSQGLAIASMLTGIVGLVVGTFCLGPIPGIVALILGLIALSQIKKSPEQVGGKPFAIAGVVIGGISVAIYGLIMILFILARVFS